MTKIKEFLEKYGKGTVQGTRLNQFGSKPVSYSWTEVDVAKFNEIYTTLLKSDLNKLERTEAGTITRDLHNRYAWDCYSAKTGIRLTICVEGLIFVFRVGRPKFNESKMQGYKAWKIFNKLCLENGIDLEKYAIDNGEEVKKEIEKPLIQMNVLNETLENVHHIDFHNSYPAGLCNTHPEFRKVIEPLYKARKTHPENKDILNCVVGYMQSLDRCKARWAHLSKDAIHDNNTRIFALVLNLKGNGNRIIGFNTDGIWYQGKIYHNHREEGPELGQWHNDYVNCTFRAKSHGAYEFIENGVYTPVVRGLTKLDEIKPRDQWVWGDIFQKEAEVLHYKFVEGKGIIKKDEEDQE